MTQCPSCQSVSLHTRATCASGASKQSVAALLLQQAKDCPLRKDLKNRKIKHSGDAQALSFWPAIGLFLVIASLNNDYGIWSWAGFLFAGYWFYKAFFDLNLFLKQWVCRDCGQLFSLPAFSPMEKTDTTKSGAILTRPEKAKSTKKKPLKTPEPKVKTPKLNGEGKTCSICGDWHAHSEFHYGKRSNRSYCKTCNKEDRAARTRGGKEAARALRESKRAAWKSKEREKTSALKF